MKLCVLKRYALAVSLVAFTSFAPAMMLTSFACTPGERLAARTILDDITSFCGKDRGAIVVPVGSVEASIVCGHRDDVAPAAASLVRANASHALEATEDAGGD